MNVESYRSQGEHAPTEGSGNLMSRQSAEQVQGYVLVDRATYLAARAEGTSLTLFYAGDAECTPDNTIQRAWCDG